MSVSFCDEMMNASRFLTTFLPILYLTLSLPAVASETDERSRIWHDLQELDRNFAADSRQFGVPGAFLKYLAKDSVVFRHGPVAAREIYEEINPELVLDRVVESRAHYLDFSQSGDLAVIAGPYRRRIGTGEFQIMNNGYYISVWKKIGEQWMLEADIGVNIPGFLSLEVVPELEETDRAYRESPDAGLVPDNAFQTVIDAETRFVSAINYRGGRRAMLRYGLANQRVYIPGMAPAIGSESGALAYGSFLDDTLSMDLLQHEYKGGAIASSGEFAYTYGTMGSENSRFTTNYLRVWRFTRDGEWKVAVEVLKPY